MKLKFFAGTISHWGLGVDLDFNDKSFTISLIRWFVAIEWWTK